MKKIQSFAWIMAIALTGTGGLTACTSEDNIDENVVYDSNGNAGVKSEFVISIPRSVIRATRMGDDITQKDASPSSFRGIDNIRLIAFEGEPTASTSKKNTDIMTLDAMNPLIAPGAFYYKVYADKFVPVGTTHFLFYGKAIDASAETAISSMDDKFKYGILNAAGLTDANFALNNIVFSPVPINTSDAEQAGNATGQRIVKLLTELAHTTAAGATAPDDKWSTTTNFSLATLYKNFIGLSTGSSETLAAILSRLYFSADRVLPSDPARSLANNIRSKINAACSTLIEGSPATLKSDYDGYPQNLGLPAGAARLKWDADLQVTIGSETFTGGFVDIAAQYSETFRQKLTDYVYPAALWYYVNTPLKAAGVKKSDAYGAQDSWKEVIDKVYNDAQDAVEAGTQSIALKNPVQYGVGRIETAIKMEVADAEHGPYYDRNGKEVNVTNGFTLKGFLLGGQSSVGYDFTTKTDDNVVIYDRQMASSIKALPGSTTSANQTLALETKKKQVVNAALELVNNGNDFMGADGIIPAGGTFYLAVRLDPETASNYDDETGLNKIVIQDHVTKITVTIKKGNPYCEYVKDEDGVPIGIDTDGDGVPDDPAVYDIDGDGDPDTFIPDPDHGGPGWDTDGDGEVDIPVLPDDSGEYPDSPNVPEGLGDATNGIPDLSSPSIELGTSVDLEWQEGLILNPNI